MNRTTITRHAPTRLLNDAVGRCLMGWMLIHARCTKLPDGRWRTETTWERHTRWVDVQDSEGNITQRLPAYGRVDQRTALRLLWFLLRSAEEKAA